MRFTRGEAIHNKVVDDIFHIYKLNKIFNCDDSGHVPLCEKIANNDDLVLFDESYKHNICAIDRMDYISDYDKFADDLIDFQHRVYLKDTDLEMVYNNVVSRQSYHIHNPYYFVANDIELKLAKDKIKNPKLQPVNCEYIKSGAEMIDPIKYNNLFNETMKLIREFDDIFAKYMYDRRTLNIKPVRLNLKPECRNKRYNIDQYPINKDKRISVINETTHFDNNGFWIPCDSSVHNTPYTVILKKPTAGGYIRARMAFDARQINNDCVLLEANYPTPKEFDDHYSRGFLTTTCDFKGYFDCIPVHPDDSEFLIVKTPLGLRKILHLSYGWKNSAANAQRITNQVCMEVGHMIGFIDDCSIRHPEEWGTKELIAHMRHFFEVCRKYNLLLHPEKFFPFALEVECLGIKRSIHGSEMTTKYKKKLLSLQKPTTPKELHAALGAINYVSRYLYNHAMFAYWLIRLQHECERKKKLEWTPPANHAWNVLKFLIENAPVLKQPKNYGKFAMKSDACPYGVGSVLYQEQYNKEIKKWEWVIIDMFSKVIPKSLRSAHCSIHEGLALVWPSRHWVHHLLRAPFVISTDHKPLLSIFEPTKDLTDITKKQLYRLALSMSDFDFEIKFIPGLENKIADQLSRFQMKLIEINAIEPDLMYNDNTKPLTKDQKFELETKYAQWTKMVKRLKCNKHPSVMNINFETSNKHKSWINLKIGLENEKNRQILNNSKSNAPKQIQDILENTFDPSIINDDDTIDNKLYNSLTNIKHHLANLKDLEKDCSKIKSKLHELAKLHLKELYNVMNEPFKNDNNNDNSNTNSSNQINQVHTRSYWRNLNKQREKHQYIEPHIANMQDRMYHRRQFLNRINKYRPKIDVFDIKTYLMYQKSDNLCNIIFKWIKDPEFCKKDDTILKKFADLKLNNNSMYKRIKNNKFRLNKNEIIETEYYSTFDHSKKWLVFVPTKLIRTILDYCHHNAYFQHFGRQQTFDNIEARFWWQNMRFDCNKWCDNCLLCQFIKGSPTHTAPMQIRELPFPRTHVMADFLGPFWKHYYILVMIDYGSGYCMLNGTIGCGVEEVLNMILDNWVPILGWFETFESDLGSAFRAGLIRRIYNLLGIKQIWSEPRNHKGTGKVERTIRMIQQIINAYNVESGQIFTDTNKHTLKQRWETLNSMLPFIQFSLNQKRSRFTNLSPNIIMFGSQLNEIQDIGLFSERLNVLKREFKRNEDSYEYIECLVNELQFVWKQFSRDWSEYAKITKKDYDNRYNVDKKLNRNLKLFKPGAEIVYFCGDRQETNRKWRQRWTGPWEVMKRLDESTIVIADNDGTTCPVSVDRVKLYQKDEYYSLKEYNDMLEERLVYRKMLDKKEILETRKKSAVMEEK